MGLGLDRLMVPKGVDDIRLLRSNDPRVATQMLDLRPYRPVSASGQHNVLLRVVIRDLERTLTDDEANAGGLRVSQRS